MLSFTADCPVSVYSTTGTNADINVTLWSLQKGIKGFQLNPKVQEIMVDLHGDHTKFSEPVGCNS